MGHNQVDLVTTQYPYQIANKKKKKPQINYAQECNCNIQRLAKLNTSRNTYNLHILFLFDLKEETSRFKHNFLKGMLYCIVISCTFFMDPQTNFRHFFCRSFTGSCFNFHDTVKRLYYDLRKKYFCVPSNDAKSFLKL